MTVADTPALFDVPPPTAADTTPTAPASAHPAPVGALLAALLPGWTTDVTHARGTLDKGVRADQPDARGKRPTITTTLHVESIALRARHTDGRAIAAVWAREVGARTPTGRPKTYSYALGWRGRHPGEDTPTALAAGEVAPYLHAADPAAALHAVEQVRADLAERAARTAAAKRANAARRRTGGDVVELRPTADTEPERVAA